MADTQEANKGLRCQWCSVQLAPGTTICPTCGSPGIPDPDMVMPEAEPETISGVDVEQKPEEELVEFWHDEPAGHTGNRRKAAEPEDQIGVYLGLVGVVVFCIIVGVVVAPTLLSPLMENITGSEVENPGNLRSVGGFVGFLIGLFIATIGLWVSQPGK